MLNVLLMYTVLAYLALGFLVWALVIYLPRRQCTVSFALKSGFLLILFWPPFIYVSGRRILGGKYKERCDDERTFKR